MKGFRRFLEMKFDRELPGMQSHPQVTAATVGVEVEFTAAAAPYADMRPEWLMYALKGTDYERDFISTYQHGDPDYEGDDDDFTNYISTHKRDAWDAFWDTVHNYAYSPNEQYGEDYKDAMLLYWSRRITSVIRSAGFSVRLGQNPKGEFWAVGLDGSDGELGLPIVEIRSGILSQQDMPGLLQVFQGLSQLYGENRNEPEQDRPLIAKGNTGFHVHIHNARTGDRSGYPDMFARLSAAADVDEDWVWDTSAPHDRAFQRHAALNKPQNFTTGSEARWGGHDQISSALRKLMQSKALGSNYKNPLWVSNEELSLWVMGGMGRNTGVNVTSEHPTVEYRYFSSLLVVEDPQKAMRAVQYFVQNTAQRSSKDRIRFESSDGDNWVLTRLPQDMVRIDYVKKGDMRNDGEDEYGNQRLSLPRIPRAGRKTDDLADAGAPPTTALGRPLSRPFSQWVTGRNAKDMLRKRMPS